MALRKALLSVTVEFNDEHTTPERLRRSFQDSVLLSSNQFFDGHGQLVFGAFEVGTLFSLVKPESLCAVLNCGRAGVNATCPYDGSSHGHGRVHYECHKRWVPWTELEFEDLAVGGWRLICREHLDQMNSEIQQEQARKA